MTPVVNATRPSNPGMDLHLFPASRCGMSGSLRRVCQLVVFPADEVSLIQDSK